MLKIVLIITQAQNGSPEICLSTHQIERADNIDGVNKLAWN